MLDMASALVAARYFESVRHVQEGSKGCALGRGLLYRDRRKRLHLRLSGVRIGGFATIHSQTSRLKGQSSMVTFLSLAACLNVTSIF